MSYTQVRALYADAEAFGGQEIQVAGWLRTVRDSKTFAFLELNDGSCHKSVQVVATEALPNFREAAALNVGTAVVVRGTLLLTPNAQQPFELQALEIVVEGASPPDYPLQKKRHSMEFLREIAHLRPRTNTFSAVFRVRSEAAFAIHDFFHRQGFVYAHTPIITVSDAEGAGEMFRATTLDLDKPPRCEDGSVDFSEDFFGKGAHLTVSGQLNAECFAQSFGKTYTFGPTFRAEKSNTARHAAEFWMVEPEIAFADLTDVMDLGEAMMKHILTHVMDVCEQELAFCGRFVDTGLLERLSHVRNNEFARMTYTEAVAALEKNNENFQFPAYWGCDLQTEHERYLTEKVVGLPVFVTDYPQDIKSFYMRQNDDGKTVAACDLLVAGVGELIGGSQREERFDRLTARIEQLGLPPENYDWYLDLRRFGSTRHGGYGIGFDRLIMYLTGIGNIRDVLPFPRVTGWAEF